MSESKLVSVIMTAYNCEKYIEDSIKSVLDQDYFNFELIIVNDCSSDNTSNIISKFKDSRIKYIENKNNLGLVKSANIGLRAVKGEYISRIDSDDVWEKQKLSKQISFLKENDLCLVGCRAKLIDSEGNEIGFFNYPKNKIILNKLYLLISNPFINSSVLFKKEIINKVGYYNESFVLAEDYELWTRIVPFCKSNNMLDYLVKYRIHDSQITFKKKKLLKKFGSKVQCLAFFRLLKSIFYKTF